MDDYGYPWPPKSMGNMSDVVHTLPKTGRLEGPKMMVWKRYAIPFIHGNFWYQFVRFLGCNRFMSVPHEVSPTKSCIC